MKDTTQAIIPCPDCTGVVWEKVCGLIGDPKPAGHTGAVVIKLTEQRIGGPHDEPYMGTDPDGPVQRRYVTEWEDVK